MKQKLLLQLSGSCFIIMLSAASCKHHDVYESTCLANQTFKKLSFRELIANPDAFNGKYVEICGKYISGKEQAALADSAALYTINGKLLWVSFSPECPLYQPKTHAGLFEDYSIYKKLDGRLVTIRGQVNTRNHGYQHQYKAALEQVSMLKW